MTRCTSLLFASLAFALTVVLAAPAATPANAQGGAVYRCPGPPVLYTDALTPDEVRDRGCRTIEGAPITIIQAAKPKPVAAGPTGASSSGAARSADSRVDPAAQRQRDSDARRILDDELRREEDRLAQQKREFNNGEPERRGDERNFQNYLDRVAQMKAALVRTEADIAALKRELAKLPP